jgi:hypothetical protein
MSSIPHLDKRNQHTAVYCNGEKILFEPLFGYAQYVPLPNSKRKIFNISNLSDKQLGKELLEVLSNSRTLDIAEVNSFFNNERLEKEDKECLSIMIKLFNKKNKTELYKCLMKIRIYTEYKDNVTNMRPTKHCRSDVYSGISPGEGPEIIRIPLSSSDEEIGEALKLALTRCTGLGAYEFHKKLKALGWEK